MSPGLRGRDITPGNWLRPRETPRPGAGSHRAKAEMDGLHLPAGRMCDTCGTRLHPLLVAAGQTWHDGVCDPSPEPKLPPWAAPPQPKRRRRSKHDDDPLWWICRQRPCPLGGQAQWDPFPLLALQQHTASCHSENELPLEVAG